MPNDSFGSKLEGVLFITQNLNTTACRRILQSTITSDKIIKRPLAFSSVCKILNKQQLRFQFMNFKILQRLQSLPVVKLH